MAVIPRLLAAAALASTLALGLARPAAARDDIVWARYGDIDTLDPQRATSTLSLQVWSLIYDTLLATDANGRPVPNLAKSYAMSPDGRQYTFQLHAGVTCSDGSTLDANDVKYTVERALDPKSPSVTKAAWGPITRVDVLGPQTVRFDLATPFVALPSFLADSFSSIICKSNAGHAGFGTTSAIGSGPWKFVSWTKGERIVLERNPAYRNFGKLAENKGPPYMQRLVITVVPEPEARLAALRTGAADIAEPPLEDVPALEKSKKLQIIVASNTGQDVFFEFAAHKPPFNDERARQAVAYATDPEAAIKLIYGNLSEREWCPIARGVFGNDEAFCEKHGYPYDPAKAKALLAEMGYGPQHPLEVTFIGWTGGERDKLMEIFQAQLAAGRHQGRHPDHGYRVDERARPPGEREPDHPGQLRHDDLVLVRSGHPLFALALARRLSRLHLARPRQDAGADAPADRPGGAAGQGPRGDRLPDGPRDRSRALYAGLGMGVRGPPRGQRLPRRPVRLPDLQRRKDPMRTLPRARPGG